MMFVAHAPASAFASYRLVGLASRAPDAAVHVSGAVIKLDSGTAPGGYYAPRYRSYDGYYRRRYGW